MKVKDIMQRSTVTISENKPLKDVARIIYRLGIAGIPVVRGKKMIGIVTERDVLALVYPTMGELVDDYFRASNFELMEKNFSSVLDLPVSKVMNKNPVTRDENISMMEAQSVMLINNISRLPVVDKNDNLVGIVSQGDIFRSLMSREISELETRSYESFVSHYYDRMVDWRHRFKYEMPTLIEELQNNGSDRVLDLGVWTGRHTTELANESSFSIVGVDHNPLMIDLAESKRKRSSKDVQARLMFKLTEYKNLRKDVGGFDAVLSMGNALPFIPIPLEDLIGQLNDILPEKKGIILFQILNFAKYERKRDRLLSFAVKRCIKNKSKEHLTFDSFDRKNSNILYHNTILFDREGDSSWVYQGRTTIPINDVKKDVLSSLLKKAGFSDVFFAGGMGEYQGEYGKLSFKDKFDPLNSDWMNVVAKR
jgi:CBS domain-containing protein/SAM-dependent methyltransferase